jgi:hypothetical protein
MPAEAIRVQIRHQLLHMATAFFSYSLNDSEFALR